MDAIGGAHTLRLPEPLQLLLHARDRLGIEQLPQAGVSEQIAQLLLIDRESLRAAFGKRGIAIVNIVGRRS